MTQTSQIFIEEEKSLSIEKFSSGINNFVL